MADAIVEFNADTVRLAIDLVAKASASASGRHIEWIKRRLREAVRFTSEHGTDHPDYAAHHELAFPVWQTASVLGGLIADGKIN